MIKAVVFDMDGTLVDSREMILGAMEATLADHGMIVTREQMAAVTGKPVDAMYALLAPHLDSAALEKMHFEHQAASPHHKTLYENGREVLTALRGRGLKLGIFTGFDRRTHDDLTNLGVLDYFESIVDCTRYEAHKPDPEGLLLCMQELGVFPDETVYVGDGIGDIAAGLAAGVHTTIGIAHGFTMPEKLAAAGADKVVANLAELQQYLEELL